MKTNALPFQKILFVCTNCREPDERICCTERGSVALHADLKQWVKDQKLKRFVRVCKSGCMDRCEEGPNVLVMPDNRWFSAVDEAGVVHLKAQILSDLQGDGDTTR